MCAGPIVEEPRRNLSRQVEGPDGVTARRRIRLLHNDLLLVG